ncbi:MAG: hypothetical protein ABIA47_03940 [bacterium]
MYLILYNMFFLGRWSDSGLFPLIGEMVADTISFLRTNKERLEGFGQSPYWHTPDGSANGSLLHAGDVLQGRAREMIRHFEAGTLFNYLRGTLDSGALQKR